MNMIQIGKVPEDVEAYVQPPDSAMQEHAMEHWIRTMVKQGTDKLHIRDCFLQTIANVEADLATHKYKVLILPIAGTTASAEFFLVRTPI
ncbi:MAG: hypothetical protein HY299_00860 [Verrucomicrobia bacterium]|nr:hypothetical protein [Verrucomicrobiota bacterium]